MMILVVLVLVPVLLPHHRWRKVLLARFLHRCGLERPQMNNSTMNCRWEDHRQMRSTQLPRKEAGKPQRRISSHVRKKLLRTEVRSRTARLMCLQPPVQH